MSTKAIVVTDMGELTSKGRNRLPKKDFGEPGERKYPMPDKNHAANAKARASQQEKKGNLSESEEKKIDAKANHILRDTNHPEHDKHLHKLMP